MTNTENLNLLRKLYRLLLKLLQEELVEFIRKKLN